MRKLCAVGVLLLTAAFGAGSAAAAEEERIPAIGPSTVATDACMASFSAEAFDKALPEGTVAPGQPVAVDVVWRTAWHSGDNVDVLGCVAANGRFVAGTVERGVANSGMWVHKFSVPANAANDARVCAASIVIGPGAGGAPQAERTDPDCFTVAAAAVKAEPAPAAANPAPAGGIGKETASPAAPAAGPAPQARTAASATLAAPANPAPRVAAATAPAKVPVTQLPHTGARARALVLLAGSLLIVGGWTFGLGRSASALE